MTTIQPANKTWLLSITAFVFLGLAISGAGYWWFNRGIAGTSAGEASGGAAPTLNPQQVVRGEQLYQNNCAQCHGLRGEGDPNWRQRNPDGTLLPPPHNSTGHTWHHADSLLYQIIHDGGAIYETLGFKSSMPAFGDQLTPEEIWAVITYFKSLWDPDQRASQAEVSRQEPLP